MFKFPCDITIAKAESFKQSALEYIDEHDAIVFDDSEVIKIDTIGAQLLLSLVVFITTQNKSLNWQHSSEIVKETMVKLGINDPMLTQYLNSPN